jgi:hypothetical protein
MPGPLETIQAPVLSWNLWAQTASEKHFAVSSSNESSRLAGIITAHHVDVVLGDGSK